MALLVLLPCLAGAQSPARVPVGMPGAVLPPIGLPLSSIGLPLAPLGLGPATETRTPSGPTAPPEIANLTGDGRHHAYAIPHAVYLVPDYGSFGWPLPPAVAMSRTPPIPEKAASAAVPAATGTLRLDLSPRPTGPLFVDGAFVGTLDEVGDEMTMAAGVHQLEIRERGFTPFTLSVRIDAGRTLVYRGRLERDPQVRPSGSSAAGAAVSPSTPTPRARKLFYFIPGCYLGDVPPKDAGLPPSCDLSRTVVYRP